MTHEGFAEQKYKQETTS